MKIYTDEDLKPDKHNRRLPFTPTSYAKHNLSVTVALKK